MTALRIGAGAGFSGDRIEPAIELVEKGALDYIVFECLAERTIALAQQARLANPAMGFDPMLERRMRAVLPAAVKAGTKIITNMGAANPIAAAKATQKIARELGLKGLRIAAIIGDDVMGELSSGEFVLDQTGSPAKDLNERLISANAYTGAFPIVDALEAGADIIITGRASDPAMFLAPLIHRFGWGAEDWHHLGCGILVGHLLECAGQVTGGYYADPGFKDVPNLARLGFPLAEVQSDGSAVITKVAGSGGQVTRAICIEQLLYEVHDPARYLQPDVVADFSNVAIREIAADRVEVSGATGHSKTGFLKVSVGYSEGWLGEGQISYAGSGAVARGNLAMSLVEDRIAQFGPAICEARGDLIGLNSVTPQSSDLQPPEVRMRFAASCDSQEDAARIGEEVESLYLNGPAGGGGVTRSTRQIIAIASTLIPEAAVKCSTEMLEV